MSETFKERMKRIRIRAGFKSQKEAADAIGCSRGNVGMWEAPSSPLQSVGHEWLFQVARAYKVKPEWINNLSDVNDGYPRELSARKKIKINASEIHGVEGSSGTNPEREVMIPVHDIEMSCGHGTVIPEFIETKYSLPFQIDWLNKWDAKPENIRIFKIRGASMEPVLYDGDKVVIHTSRKRIINDCVYSLIYGDEGRVKRLFKTVDGRLRVVSDNQDKDRYPDEYLSQEDFDKIFIVGQIIGKMGSGGLGF